MRERMRNALVGLCAIGAIGGGSALLFFFGELEPAFASRWPLEVAFNEAGGLRKGSLVTLNGVPVGSVEQVRFWGDRDQPVLVTAAIDDDVKIPEPSVASVQASLLGSGARLELTAALPLRDPPRHYPTDKRPLLRGRVQQLDDRIIEQLDTRLDPVVRSFTDLGALARSLNDLVKPGEDGAPPDPESLRTAVRRLNDTLANADGALASARRWLDDEQLATDVRDAAHGASELMRDATVAANRIGAAADSITADARALRESALPVLDRASVALEDLDRLLVAARTGDGTVGRLVKDPALYEGLADAARRLDDALVKVNLLLDKIREEGIDVELLK
jgi:phospholipid/cholesterol/gamma-HCH transport system substrate-binding protein